MYRASLTGTMLSLFLFSMGFAQARQQETDAPRNLVRKSALVLREEATTQVEPTSPPLARAAKVSGPVTVEVVIDEEGNVISARAVSGHPLLKDAAIAASRQWKFKRTELSGIRMKVIGNIVFDFMLDGVKPRPEVELREKTTEELEKEICDNPDSERAHYDLGVAYNKAHRFPDAISQFKEAIRINPKSSEAHYKLGVAFQNAERYEEAAAAYSRTVEIDPEYWNNDAAYYGLALIHLKLERYEQAIEALTQSLKISPSVMDSQIALGVAYSMLGRYAEAIAPLKRALEIHNEFRESQLKQAPIAAHFWLGRAYLALGDKLSARRHYQALKQLDKEKADQLLREIEAK